MKKPTVREALDEIRRLTAENARLKRLIQTNRPELAQLRAIEVGLRDFILNGADELRRIYDDVYAALGTQSCDDLPSLMEFGGICSNGRERVYAALTNLEELQTGEHDDDQETP